MTEFVAKTEGSTVIIGSYSEEGVLQFLKENNYTILSSSVKRNGQKVFIVEEKK